MKILLITLMVLNIINILMHMVLIQAGEYPRIIKRTMGEDVIIILSSVGSIALLSYFMSKI